MKLAMSEILHEVPNISARKDKIAYLKKHYSPQLHRVLEFALNPDIKFSLPEGHPPFTKLTENEGHGILYQEARKLNIFVTGGHEGLDNNGKQGQITREKLFIGLLEQVHPNDAILLIGMKDKKLPYHGVSYKLVKEAYGEYRG